VDRSAILDEVELIYLYNEGDDFHFMNTGKRNDSWQMTRDELGETIYYLVPNTPVVKIELFEEGKRLEGLPATSGIASVRPTDCEKETASAGMKDGDVGNGVGGQRSAVSERRRNASGWHTEHAMCKRVE